MLTLRLTHKNPGAAGQHLPGQEEALLGGLERSSIFLQPLAILTLGSAQTAFITRSLFPQDWNTE